TFGIAVDYAVNIWKRASDEPSSAKGLERTLVSTGGAVFLCSLTTIIGYFTLVVAKNMALASMGKLAMLGEFTCLAAAMLLLPAILRLRPAPESAAVSVSEPAAASASPSASTSAATSTSAAPGERQAQEHRG